MISRRRELAIVVLTLVLALPTLVAADSSAGPKSEARVGVAIPLPNIVVVLMDDIGIDQWALFGYGGTTPAATPNIAAIANGGVMFHNMWAMPACSNGRAALFTGRYPFRTNVLTAIGSDDLANYMVNPNEITLPKLLKQRGYQSALFGKFHLGIQGNDPYGLAMVHALGFDYFDGWLDETGDPSSIDTTAGGVANTDPWPCGFVQDAAHKGADIGACYAADGTCSVISKTGAEAPGRVCRDSGGIFDPNQACTSPTPAKIQFSNYSGHYVSPLMINNPDGTVEQVPVTDIRSRTWRATQLVDAAIGWVNSQPRNQPWMAALSFSLGHTPFMQPPSQTLPPTEPDSSNLACSSDSSDSTTGGDCSFGCKNIADQRLISNEMEESLDFEIGRFLITTGIATAGPNGQLLYDPGKTNTYVIFVTDNGSLGSVVKPPFDPTRAKSTAYQTGVWVPGIVAGPAVVKPGRETNAMVNIVDIYQLMGELAGIDVHKSVKWIVDAQSMLPYLTNPKQPSIRSTNYTEIGTNQHAKGAINGPCVYGGNTCTQIAPTQGVCQDNNGEWWGQGATAPQQFCCEVAIYQHDHNQSVIKSIYPLSSYAIRNDRYKLVVSQFKDYDATTNACVDTPTDEFYEINEDEPPKLDTAPSDLLARKKPLTSDERKNYLALKKQVNALRSRQPFCVGDINLDRAVTGLDVGQWAMFKVLSGGNSSWADINQDGMTDGYDALLIEQDFGECPNKADSAGFGG